MGGIMRVRILDGNGINDLKIFLKNLILNIEEFVDQELHEEKSMAPPEAWYWSISVEEGSIIIDLHYRGGEELEHFISKTEKEYLKEIEETKQ